MAKNEALTTSPDLGDCRNRPTARRGAAEPPRPAASEESCISASGRTPPSERRRIVRRREALDRLGIGQSTLYDWIKRGEFPKPVRLGPKLVGWPDDVFDEWLESRVGCDGS